MIISLVMPATPDRLPPRRCADRRGTHQQVRQQDREERRQHEAALNS
jgi:hypothetical protein